MKFKITVAIVLCMCWGDVSGAMAVVEDSGEERVLHQRMVTMLYHQGIVLPHHANMVYFIDDFSRGLEINYGLLRFDAGGWQKWYNYPEAGIGLFYNTFGNYKIYGHGLALYPYLQFSLIRTGIFTLSNKVALGLGYVNKPFHYRHNPNNHIFGSHFNAYVGLGLYSSLRVTKELSARASASLNHLSNGGIRKPNNGINTLTFSMGVRYHFTSDQVRRMERLKAPSSNRREIQVFMSYGSSQANDFNLNHYPCGTVAIHHLWYRSVKSAWSAGLDFMYFGSAPYLFQKAAECDPGAQRWFYGLSAGKYWIMGSTTAFMQVGLYLYSEINPPQALYPRIGLRQKITKELMANFSVKASFFRAEFIEFGLGYCFDYKKNRL